MKFILLSMWTIFYCQEINGQPDPGPVAAAGANPPPPPGRGFQLECSDQYAYLDECDPNLIQQFTENAPPGYRVQSVFPCIYPGKNAHRYLVQYETNRYRRCENIRQVHHEMSTYKPQNSNVGNISVVPGGYLVEYKQFCLCYRRSFRRRRSSTWKAAQVSLRNFSEQVFITMPKTDTAGNVMRCDDRDQTCGPQNF